MFRKKKYILLTGLFIMSGLFTSAQQSEDIKLIDDIEKGFLGKRPELIVKYFDEDVKLIILEDSYSPDREEAIILLEGFLRRNPVKSVENKFKSGKSQSNFIIKILRTEKKAYRVTIFFRSSDGIRKINLMRIEQENEPAL